MSGIRRRLGVGLAVGITFMWCGATLVASSVIRHEMTEVFDSAMQETAQRVLSLAVLDLQERAEDEELQSRRTLRLNDHEELLSYVVRDRFGRVVLASHDAKFDDFLDRMEPGFRTTATHRIYGESDRDGRFSIEVADPIAHRREALTESVLGLAAPLLLLVPMSFGLVWSIVRSALRGVERLRREIEIRDDSSPNPLSSDDVPVELRSIVASFNALLARLHRALTAERSFAANSAHELRTPIATALAQTQRLVRTLPDDESRERALRIEETLHGLSRLSEKLMQLARAESGLLVSDRIANLYPVLEQIVVEQSRIPGVTTEVRFEIVGDRRFGSRLDADGLAILLRNLIENARKYASEGSVVEVVLDSERNTIRVVNDCSPITPERLDELRTRFVRGSVTISGAGLGLSIVDAVVKASAVEVELRSPATDRSDGFEAIVTETARPGADDGDRANLAAT